MLSNRDYAQSIWDSRSSLTGNGLNATQPIRTLADARWMAEHYLTPNALDYEGAPGAKGRAQAVAIALWQIVCAKSGRFVIELVESNVDRAMLERRPRYDLMLNGEKIGQLYYNMTGYTGAYLPMKSGGALHVPERAISAWRREVAVLNRENREALKVGATTEGDRA